MHAERPEEIVNQIRCGSPSPYQRNLAGLSHFRCRVRCLFISNMVPFAVPKTFVSLSSARISRRFSGFCRLCERMYSQILLTTSPRGRGLVPTTAASSSDGCSGFCSAFGLPSLALLFDVLVGIDLLHRPGVAHNVPPCLRINASIAAAKRAAPRSGGGNAGVDV